MKTRNFRRLIPSCFQSIAVSESLAVAHSRSIDLNPLIAAVARPVPTANALTRIGDIAEMLRMSPYHQVPVVSADNSELLGLVTETAIATALLEAPDTASRTAIMRALATQWMEPVGQSVSPFERAGEVAAILDNLGIDSLPVVDHNRRFLGMASRADLIRELFRPLRPPTIGGMATLTGVYLTTGVVSGGATAASLVFTGLLMFFLQHIPMIAVYPIGRWAEYSIGTNAFAQQVAGDLLPTLLSVGMFFVAVRLSPIAGFHAAEHQVVHALERSEPLLAANVRAMPRVHPRCGTNLVAAGLIFTVIGATLQPIAHLAAPSLDNAFLGFVAGGIVAIAYWRSVGNYLQEHWTTRPASDYQIESGIRAANELLERHSNQPFASARPIVRLLRMGLVQMVTGFIIGYALLILAGRIFPVFGEWIKPILLA